MTIQIPRVGRRRFLQGASAIAVGLIAQSPSGSQASQSLVGSQSPTRTGPGERLSLDYGWRFHRGDIPFPKVKGHGWSYANAKAGSAWGAAFPDYDDSDWRALDLPHDWVVEQPFDPNENLAQGYRARGVGWYRRALRLEDSDRGKHIELQFDGIATHATVWFNGSVVARNWSGYNSIYIDLTPFARYGDELNSLVVRVDADPMEGWWYEGGGVYRHVWLVKRAPVHIATDGVHADPRRQSDGGWTVPVAVTLGNIGEATAEVEVTATLLSPTDQVLAEGRTTAQVAALGDALAQLTLQAGAPKLWSIESPTLYRVRTTVRQGGRTVDEAVTTIGFRTLRFDADKGFFLNDLPLKVKGVCLHQDHAGVGVAVPDSLWDFRLRKMKALGANAIRCSHNAPAVEMLDAADRLGLLILDENRNFNPSKDYIEQLEWLIRRDRNHPSVFLWSVFNEEPMQGTEAGYQMVRRMVAAVKRLDDSRPVTAAMNDGMFTPINVSQAVDVVGFNYQIDNYDKFHAAHPNLPLISSEDASAYQSRGEFVTDKARNVLASYDDEAAPWGATHHRSWKAIDERPYLAGGFAWTGFDYRGEPTPYEWPSTSAFMGILDLCGFPKGAAYFRQAMWIKDRPILQILPHWNWPGREGQAVKVMAVTNAERVRLVLNGRTVSEQAVDPYAMASWQVPYAPGRLEAFAYVGGRQVAHAVVETTSALAALRLIADGPSLNGDGRDALTITVEGLDTKGRVAPTANAPVTFAIEGARIIGLGNGDQNSHEAEKGDKRSLFNGLAQVIIQTDPGARAPVRLTGSSPGLKSASLVIPVTPKAAEPSVPSTAPVTMLSDWRKAPLTAVRPDPNLAVADNDMNSWDYVRPGSLEPASTVGGWSLYRARFTPRASVRRSGGRLVFARLAGAAEVWQGDRLLGHKLDAEAASWSVDLPPGEGSRTLSLLLNVAPGQPHGLGGVVFVQENSASPT